ncbi:MAG: DUF3365 domain-containing protein [Lentimicrobiaceae bacterium]|nr:DUF3365 domain-containing protein [Lentimicrobiaceae bacterium]MCP4910688.1 DUF3365 domain-containing protein [Bacteroidota bacterium]MBT3454582.1 DUF3365 domain-containing protein [Lentimicrobiaceae bacterium]MBT3818280.1 DUF3365 domain-containing protein [Lentimicrobiaceae bacterium]MBT4062239.1 DUF3365 domain-containing protein [Lentimicrobiaceae bacterium]
MNKYFYNYLIIFMFILSSCSNTPTQTIKEETKEKDVKVSYISQNNQAFKTIKKKGSSIAIITQVELGKSLKNAMASGGPENAISFCNLDAMRITDSIAKAENVIVKRLAKKNRNVANKMDDFESKIYKQYVMEYLDKKPLKAKVAVNQNSNPVYYKPILTNNMCLTCHGTPGSTMTNELNDKIKELYPDDKAINFEDGQPRGMWAITFANVNVNPKLAQ